MNAIYILWLRQLKRYSRSRARIIGSLGQPLLFFIAFGFGFGPIYSKAGAGNYLEFLGPGVITMAIVFTAMFAGIEVIWDRQFGFLKETLVAPVSRFNIMLGRTIGGATVAVIQGGVVFVLALIIGFRPTNLAYLPFAFIFMFLIATFYTAFGTAIASRLQDMQAFPLIMNFLVMPMVFLSSALFPLAGLPKAIEIISRANPLTYGVDGLRWALDGQSFFSPLIDFSVLSVFTLIVLAIGSYLFSKIEI
ncbi:MAG: ABC transporter permease [Patescibacteria group bacterium]|nr:ABC transporter permease [Patescibacteria group bacterium]